MLAAHTATSSFIHPRALDYVTQYNNKFLVVLESSIYAEFQLDVFEENHLLQEMVYHILRKK